jgi:curved DNA-binding protein CbpA
MTPQTELEIQGNFFTHPFAELVSEIDRARLTGSLRSADKEKKWVMYFKAGRIVFAVSNAKSSRLFDIMIRRGRMKSADVLKVPNYANDFEFSSYLQEKGFVTESDRNKLFIEQIEGIIIDALSWTDGKWTFSSLMRIRDGLSFDINSRKLLLDYARCLPINTVLGRFRSLDEGFSRSARSAEDIDLTAEEEFVLSGAAAEPRSASQLVNLAAIPEGVTLPAIYTLWIAGLLVRNDWSPAFTEMQIAAMRGAKLELKREAKVAGVGKPIEAPSDESASSVASEPEPEVVLTVDEYLEQVENAVTFYDILGVDPKAEDDELKHAYLRLAKSFHPDRFHSQGGELLKRIQNAFTEIAQAHETLKNLDTREMYDYRMRKELAEREKREAAGGGDDRETMDKERAAENFETGFSLLMDEDAEQAIPFLARAAHFAPKNPRYRAYYGKALSSDESQRHKAEAEIQAAVRLDPNNPTFRLVLAEFFIQFNLLKRAEGELNRLLAIFPSNRDALDMLAKLQK